MHSYGRFKANREGVQVIGQSEARILWLTLLLIFSLAGAEKPAPGDVITIIFVQFLCCSHTKILPEKNAVSQDQLLAIDIVITDCQHCCNNWTTATITTSEAE